MDFGLDSHAIVFLFLQEQRLQAFGIFLRQFDVAQHDFLHHDSIRAEAFADQLCRPLADLFALCGEHFTHGVVRHQLSPCGSDDGGHDFFLERLREVGFHIVETLGIELIADGDGEAERESFFGLHVQRLALCDAFG